MSVLEKVVKFVFIYSVLVQARRPSLRTGPVHTRNSEDVEKETWKESIESDSKNNKILVIFPTKSIPFKNSMLRTEAEPVNSKFLVVPESEEVGNNEGGKFLVVPESEEVGNNEGGKFLIVPQTEEIYSNERGWGDYGYDYDDCRGAYKKCYRACKHAGRRACRIDGVYCSDRMFSQLKYECSISCHDRF